MSAPENNEEPRKSNSMFKKCNKPENMCRLKDINIPEKKKMHIHRMYSSNQDNTECAELYPQIVL